MKLKLTVLLTLMILLLAACSTHQSESKNNKNTIQGKTEVNAKEIKKEKLQTTSMSTLTGNEFTLVAQEASHQLNSKITVDAWTFNGSVPGPQIRVKEGEKVKIYFKNELPEPVSIHWHGITVPNDMDGVPGITQNAVQPGKTFTYEFRASVPGTYMYHSHQDSVNQIDKGLYGTFIVEPKEKTYDRDYTLMLDEWMSDPEASNMPMNNMDSMDHGNMNDMSDMDPSNMDGMNSTDHNNMDGMNPSSSSAVHGKSMAHNMKNYDVYTINRKSGDAIEPLKVKKGEKVRIRLANIGYLSHHIHLHGHKFKVVAIDGHDLNKPQEIKDQLIAIAPGERYDIEFTANNPGKWYLEDHGNSKGSKGMKTMIQYEGYSKSKDQSNQGKNLPVFSYVNYGGAETGEFTLDQKYDVEYTMNLNGNNMDNAWTINDQSFPNTDNINVKKGDLVKVKLISHSPTGVNHPMHLHGHYFQVLSKNGKPIEGSPIIKDTVNLESGDEYVVAFKADNPGNWMFHCHDLHHSSAGMMDLVKYEGYQSNYTVDSKANNNPE